MLCILGATESSTAGVMSLFCFATHMWMFTACLFGPNQSTDDSQVLRSDPPQSVFMIGNSLTWDTRPPLLGDGVQWHVDCGKNLKYIFENPSAPCVKSSVLWTEALESNEYDVLCVQPHFGTTLAQDVEVISKWLEMQPQAALLIHTGWNRSEDFEAVYHAVIDHERMAHNPAYFQALEEELHKKYPQRTISSTHAMDVLDAVLQDIASGQAPFKQFDELYRDAIHLQNHTGRYLMHNVMRQALGRETSDQGFEVDATAKKYLDQKIAEFAREPDRDLSQKD